MMTPQPNMNGVGTNSPDPEQNQQQSSTTTQIAYAEPQHGLISLIPFYNGTGCIHEFFQAIERTAAHGKWEEATKLSAALLRLKGAASEFIQVESPDISTFDNFKQALIKRFVRGEDRFASLQSFISCQQLFNESVLDYKQRLRKLANRTILHYEDENLQNQENARVEKDLLQKFITGLQPHFKAFVIMGNPTTLEEAANFAVNIEESNSVSTNASLLPILRTNVTGTNPNHVQFATEEVDRTDNSGNSSPSSRTRSPTPFYPRDNTSRRNYNHANHHSRRDYSQPNHWDYNHRDHRDYRPFNQPSRYTTSRRPGLYPTAPHSRFDSRRPRSPSPWRSQTRASSPSSPDFNRAPSFRQWRSPQPSYAHPCSICNSPTHWKRDCTENLFPPRRQPQRVHRPSYSNMTSGNARPPFRDQRGSPINQRQRPHSPGRPKMTGRPSRR